MADNTAIQPAAQTSQLTQQENYSPAILAALSKMAILRTAAAGKTYLETFSRELSREHSERVVLSALMTLQGRARREGESALPDYGTILGAIRDITHPHKTLRRIVRKLCLTHNVAFTEELFEVWEEMFGHRTDEDLERGYKLISRNDTITKMPTSGQFNAAMPVATKRRPE